MKKLNVPLLLLPFLFALSGCATAKNPPAIKTGQTVHRFSLERKQVLAANYLLFLPNDYGKDPAKRWPLIFFLHGSGARGTNIWQITELGPPMMVKTQTNFPFIVLSPQCPAGKIWSNDVLLALLDDIEANYAVDTHRVYLTGASMGGYGTWTLGLSHPERFAAIAPLCGGGDFIHPILAKDEQSAVLTSLGVWAFHGAKDPGVPLEESQRMIDFLKKLEVRDVKFTIYPEVEHNCWWQAYADPELYSWFLKHSR